MAYMDQEKKAKIAAALKKVMPKDWKYSLSVADRGCACPSTAHRRVVGPTFRLTTSMLDTTSASISGDGISLRCGDR